MKKILLLLLVTCYSFAQTGTTTAGQFKMTIPVAGANQDSVVVWNGTDKKLKFIGRSTFSTPSTPNLTEVLTAGYEAEDLPIKLFSGDFFAEHTFDYSQYFNQENIAGQIWSEVNYQGLFLHDNVNSKDSSYNVDKITNNGVDYLLPSGDTSTIATISDLESGYIPLTGTTTGNPVTGDIEMNSFSSIKAENETYRSALTVDVDNNLEAAIYTTNKDTNDMAGFGTNSSNGVSMYVVKTSESQNVDINVTIDGIIISDNGTTQRGLKGVGDYSANILDLDYTQKIYVDNQRGKLIQLTTTEILALTPEVGRLYYNTTINEVVFYNGTEWKKLSHSNM